MANYAETGKSPRTLTEREQKLLLKVTGEHRAIMTTLGRNGSILVQRGSDVLLHLLP